MCIEIAKQMRMYDSILYSRVRNLVTVESNEDQSILHKRCSPQQVYSLVDNSRQGYNHWIFIILIWNLSVKGDQQYIYETRRLGGSLQPLSLIYLKKFDLFENAYEKLG